MLYTGWTYINNKAVWSFSNADNDDFETSISADTNRHTFFVSSSMNSSLCGLYIDDNRIDSRGPSSTRCRYNYPFTLFGYFNPDGFHGSKMRIYRFTLGWYITDPYVDLIPARRKSDGVLGMYDIIRNTFYTNIGSGTFSYGEF